tara:strand:- start:2127 stop:2867 length:741 start_codon:yes stop_codon:yes gene_type:complete
MRNFLFLILIVFASCKQKNIPLTAQEIIDKAIIASGSDKISNSKIEFNFRDKTYSANRNKGLFKLVRMFKEDSILIKDELSNNGFKRFKNDELSNIPDSMAIKYTGSVNSVHYFSVLPFGLNDKAVQKKLLKETKVKKQPYYKVKISFTQDGGGEDFEDVFIYWINKETFTVDYLAYSYHTGEGGKRFRESKNVRIVNGIRFADYNNYKPKNTAAKLENLDKAFENNELIKLSEINLENVKVEILN